MLHLVPPGDFAIKVSHVAQYHRAETERNEDDVHRHRDLDVDHTVEYPGDKDHDHHHEEFQHLEKQSADSGIIFHKEQ